jgi:hypothetical protein
MKNTQTNVKNTQTNVTDPNEILDGSEDVEGRVNEDMDNANVA